MTKVIDVAQQPETTEESAGALQSALAGVDGEAAAGAAADLPEAPTVPEWANDYDHEAKVTVSKQGWKNPGDVVKSYRELRAMNDGGEKVKIPSDPNDTEGWTALRTKLGMPETADGYEFPEVELAEGEVDLTPALRSAAHRHGLSQTQAEGMRRDLFSEFQKIEDEVATKAQADQATATSELQREWGDAYKDKMQTAKQATTLLGLDAKMNVAVEQAMGTKAFLERFAAIGESLGEHAGGAHGNQSGALGWTADSAREQVDAWRADPEWRQRYLAKESRTVTEYDSMMAIAHPGVHDTT